MKFTQNSEGRKQPSSLGAHTVTQQNVEEPRTMPLVTSTRRQVSGDADDAKVELQRQDKFPVSSSSTGRRDQQLPQEILGVKFFFILTFNK